MKKIKTLFKRGSNFGVIDETEVNLHNLAMECYATEKVDGTNIRLTIRNENVVRIEARRNPSKQQKKDGIVDAWYRDAVLPQDKHILKSVNNRDYKGIPDGEYSAEAFGGKIQGNPLNCEPNVFIFSYEKERLNAELDSMYITYDDLLKTMKSAKSKFGDGIIEGIVFWSKEFKKPMYKI